MSRVLCQKDRRSYNERKEYVDYLIENESLNAKELEILSTWLLFSKDIKSGRKLEYKFHRSEKHRREYKEATGVTLLSDMADFAHNEQEDLTNLLPLTKKKRLYLIMTTTRITLKTRLCYLS